MVTRVGINGFGRIGRQAFKIALQHPELEVVAINDIGDVANMAYLLKYDSVYGRDDHEIHSEGNILFVDGKQLYQVLANEYPQVLETLSTPNSALFAGAETPVYSSIFSRGADGSICVRFRYDGLGYYAAPVCSVLPIFLDLLDKYTLAFPLQRQQGYILQNGRWLHGRTAFRGEREMYRVLVRTDPATAFGSSVHLGFQPG